MTLGGATGFTPGPDLPALTIRAFADTIVGPIVTSAAHQRRPGVLLFKPTQRRRHQVPDPRLGGLARVNTKTTYISRDGLDKLRAERTEMTNVRRPEIAQRIHDAKEHGDLSENAEYEDAKNEQAFVEGRIQTLETMIKNASLIDEHTSTDPRPDRRSTVKVKGR